MGAGPPVVTCGCTGMAALETQTSSAAVPILEINEAGRLTRTTALGAYFTADGQAYCLSEAPNSDAVCKSHESKGLTLGKGDVHEVGERVGPHLAPLEERILFGVGFGALPRLHNPRIAGIRVA